MFIATTFNKSLLLGPAWTG